MASFIMMKHDEPTVKLMFCMCLSVWFRKFFSKSLRAICEAAREPANGLDVWEQEVEEAIQAMSEPIQDGDEKREGVFRYLHNIWDKNI